MHSEANPFPPPPPFSHCPQADLQQQRPQMVFVDDPLTSRGHVRLLDVVIAAHALSCGQTENITTLTGTFPCVIYVLLLLLDAGHLHG